MDHSREEFLTELRRKLEEADELLETNTAEYRRLYDPSAASPLVSKEQLSDEGPF